MRDTPKHILRVLISFEKSDIAEEVNPTEDRHFQPGSLIIAHSEKIEQQLLSSGLCEAYREARFASYREIEEEQITTNNRPPLSQSINGGGIHYLYN